MANALAARGALRRGLTIEVATVLTRRTASPASFLRMTRVEGLSVQSCSRALAEQLQQLLLADAR